MGEVVTAPSLTPLVTAPPMILGLFNLRGEIVPLLDTAVLLGIGRTESVVFAVVLHTHQGPVGLSATAFPSRMHLEERLGSSELVNGTDVYRVGQQVAVLLDVEAVLASATSLGREPVTGPAPHPTALVRQG